jgi:hypothetical protein
MGSMKEYFLNVQDDKEEWIRDQLGDPNATDKTVGWAELEDEFYQSLFSATNEPDSDWYSNQNSTLLFQKLKDDLDQLRAMLAPRVIDLGFQKPLYKMICAHTVTLLESFLADRIKSLIVSDPYYLEQALINIENLKKKDISPYDVWKHPQGVQGIVLERLSTILYHNIPQVIKIVEAITGDRPQFDLSGAIRVVNLRHDIVHRNGKTMDGQELSINFELAEDAINQVETFLSAVHAHLENFPLF